MAPAAVAPSQKGSDIYADKYSEKFQDYLKNVEARKTGPKAVPVAPEGLRSGPQGSIEPLTIIDDPAAWTAESLQGKESEYTHTLTEADIGEIISAVRNIKTRIPHTEEGVLSLTKQDYDLPTLGQKLVDLAKNVSLGRGFQLITGFPVAEFEGDRLGLIIAFWGLALQLGTPQVSQTDYNDKKETFGSVLNHITVGRHTKVKQADVYPVPAPSKDGDQPPAPGAAPVDLHRIAFHSDQGATDLIALLSLTAAPRGGESKWVSAVAIHNELLRRGRKDLVEALSTRGRWTAPRKHDQAAFQRNADGSFAGFEDTPPFVYHNGYFSSHYASYNYQELDLTPLEQEAAWAVAALAEDPEFHLSKKLLPGDIEIIHNPTIYHSRGDVVDGESPKEKRHLLRWWVAQPKEQNPRPILPTFAPRSNVLPQGGFITPEGSALRLPFYPYSRHDGEGESPY